MKPRRFIGPLSKAEKDRVEELYRHGSNARIRRRAQAVRLSSMGYTIPQITEILGCNQQSIHNWLTAFEKGRAEALADKPRSGRPAIATAEYRACLVKAVKTCPKELGYPFTVWTVTRVRAHVARKTRILLSESRVRQIMNEEGLVFKRPRHTLSHKRDADAFAAVRDILDRAKKNAWNPAPA